MKGIPGTPRVRLKSFQHGTCHVAMRVWEIYAPNWQHSKIRKVQGVNKKKMKRKKKTSLTLNNVLRGRIFRKRPSGKILYIAISIF